MEKAQGEHPPIRRSGAPTVLRVARSWMCRTGRSGAPTRRGEW